MLVWEMVNGAVSIAASRRRPLWTRCGIARATPRPALRPPRRVPAAGPGSNPRSWVAPSAIFPGVGRAARMSSQSVDLSIFLSGKYRGSFAHCASAEKLHARGPLPVKEIAIYYDRWEGEGSLCSLQDADRDFPSFPIDSKRNGLLQSRSSDRARFLLPVSSGGLYNDKSPDSRGGRGSLAAVG